MRKKRSIKSNLSNTIIQRENAMTLHFSREPLPHRILAMVLASLRFSTRAPTQSSSTSSLPSSLYSRILAILDPKVSILPVLDKWVEEGNSVSKVQLLSLLRLMKDYKRFNRALEISHWMTDRRHFSLTPSDAAFRLALIHRVHGIEQAERYFENLPNKVKTGYAYSAILSGYVREKSVQKAEAFMQKMRERGMVTSSFPYNILINLYSQTGEIDKIHLLVQEMEKNGITKDKYTMRNLIAAFGSRSEISGVERILNQMEENPELGLDWEVYAMAANAYLKIGSMETALKMLKKMEKWMPLGRKQLAFNFILTLYAKTGNIDELYRVWNAYKPSSILNTSYCRMIQSLSKLDDIEGAEKIFEEWESKCTMYDFRVLNNLLPAYCKRGLFEKAEAALEKSLQLQGRTPHASSYYIMAMGYVGHDQMPKAVEMLKRAMLVAGRGWKPGPDIVNACLDYLEEQGGAEEMQEITRLLKNLELLTKDVYNKLSRTCIAAGKSVTEVLNQMKADGFDVDEETPKTLTSRRSS